MRVNARAHTHQILDNRQSFANVFFTLFRQAENKLAQSRLKVKSDSIELEAAKTNIAIAQRQYDRTVALQEEGLKATKDVAHQIIEKLVHMEQSYFASVG